MVSSEAMLAVLPWLAGAAACVTATICDLRTRRIPNALTLGVFALAPVLAGLNGGVATGAQAVLVALVVATAGFIMFACGLIGAGDAKLLASLAAICGYPRCIEFVFYTALCGGALALGTAASRGELIPLLARLHVRVVTSLASGNLRVAVAAQSDARLPYALAVSGGFLLVLLSLTLVPTLRIAQ